MDGASLEASIAMPHNMFCPRSPAQAECPRASAPSCVSGRGRSRARLHQRSHRHVSVNGWMWLRRPLPITWTGTNSTRYPPRTKASNISDSISKWSVSKCNDTHALRLISRNPHCESGRSLPAAAEIRRVIQRLTRRRSQGIAAALCMRLPTTSAAPVSSAQRRKTGISSGRCWPSPSRVITHSHCRPSAAVIPALIAAPLPGFPARRMACAPASTARAAVSSSELSSTTSTSGKYWRTARTSSPMLASSSRQGTTTVHVADQFTSESYPCQPSCAAKSGFCPGCELGVTPDESVKMRREAGVGRFPLPRRSAASMFKADRIMGCEPTSGALSARGAEKAAWYKRAAEGLTPHRQSLASFCWSVAPDRTT